MSVRIVSAKHARALMPMAEAIEVNATAFQQFYRKRVLNPDRLIVSALLTLSPFRLAVWNFRGYSPLRRWK